MGVLSVELASYHSAGLYSCDVAARFFRQICMPLQYSAVYQEL